MSRRMRNVELSDDLLDSLAEMFVQHNILHKHGLSFVSFIEEWKLGKEEQYM